MTTDSTLLPAPFAFPVLCETEFFPPPGDIPLPARHRPGQRHAPFHHGRKIKFLARTPNAAAARQGKVAALAFVDEATLEAEAARLFDFVSYTFLRRPEAGLVMLEDRAGNSGQRFNLGEMLITRYVVRLEAKDSDAVTK